MKAPLTAPLIAPLPSSMTLQDLIRRVLPCSDGFVLDGGPDSWTFLGAHARQSLSAREGKLSLEVGGRRETRQGDALQALREAHAPWLLEGTHQRFPFLGGAVGYLAYDLGRAWERLPAIAHDDLMLPELHMAWYDVIFAYRDGRAWIASSGLPFTGEEREAEARRRLEETLDWLSAPPAPLAPFQAEGPWRSTFTRAEYREAIAAIQEGIARGDLYQANLSQRFEVPVSGDPADLYLRLREANPAPFGAFLRVGEAALVSASPERFLQLRHGHVSTLPIKGTRPRGATPEADRALADELLASPKDRAEHLMIVDLERNDLGRVCIPGSVRVPDAFRLEAHPTVWHLVSTVEGRLRDGLDAVDLIQATFPGGSITGAPKLSAMEAIERLEPHRRGPYTGSIGYWGLDGNLDLSIVIRTALVKDGRAMVQVGGGIVADSDPDAEYQETLDKAAALLRAIDPEAALGPAALSLAAVIPAAAPTEAPCTPS